VAAPFGLSDKEREVLRLLARGHDAKSAAAALRLSVHTVNERLREARLKTGSGSSRGAARLLAAQEDPQFLVPTELGVIDRPATLQQDGPPATGRTDGSRFPGRWGIPMMTSAMTAAAIAAIAHITTGQPPAPPAPRPTAPRVVSTTPGDAAVVAPGRITLAVTFDRPMRRQSYSFVQMDAATYPDCGGNPPEQSADGRTFRLVCTVQPGRSYEVWFNHGPYMNFVGEDGMAAVPSGLRFRTRRS
jgi:DNA-binding CsgD family transcriptional regulator